MYPFTKKDFNEIYRLIPNFCVLGGINPCSPWKNPGQVKHISVRGQNQNPMTIYG
uniref:Uncharacterized protein n=1 Tax=Romanomermis culicivorax TaxID=13658 RepID=A0A915JXZ3_ROMCU